MQEDDRGRGDAARERHGERISHWSRDRVAVQAPPHARHGDEDCRDGGEGELEAGLEHRGRHPGHQHERSDREEVPAVGRSRDEPRERCQRPGDSRSDDGRLPSDREHVRRDDGENRQLAHHSGEPQEPAEPVDAGREKCDVLPRDGQQVVEARSAEVVLDVVRQALVLAEDDAEHDAATDASGSPGDAGLDPVADVIAEAGDTPSATALAPARRLEHDVDALPLEPCLLVEAVLGGARLRDPDGRLQDGSTRRRGATDRQHDQDALAQPHMSKAPSHGDDARRPWRRARGSDGHELRNAALTELALEDALPQRVHAE